MVKLTLKKGSYIQMRCEQPLEARKDRNQISSESPQKKGSLVDTWVLAE
jgi:hypothetical protein